MNVNDPQDAALLRRMLALIIGTLLVVQILTLCQALRSADLPLSVPPGIQAALSVVWAAVLAWSLYGLLARGAQDINHSRIVLAGFIIYSGLRWFLFVETDYDRRRLPLLAGILFCLLVVLALSAAPRCGTKNNGEHTNGPGL